jgi:polysaccharide pyruvyl transferase WcaK-like protein
MVADISGEGTEYHVGDEAMAEVAIERLAAMFGRDNLVMACPSPDAVLSTYGIRSFAHYSCTDAQRKKMIFSRPYSLIKEYITLLGNLMRSDVVFICGGGNMTSVWPEVLESRLQIIRWALRLKKRVLLVSQTLGPFTPEHRARCSELLSKVEWVGVRDKSFSQEQIGFPVNFAVDDAVFLQPEHSALTQKLVSERKPILGLSLRKLGDTDNQQLYTLCRTISGIVSEKRLNTIFIPHHAPRGGGDIKLAEDVKHLWPVDLPLTTINPIPRAKHLKALTADCDWVLTMRYHQLIFALSTGTPAIGIYTNQYTQAKLNGAFEQFNLPSRIMSIDEAPEKLPALVEQVLQERDLFQAAAANIQGAARELNLRPYEKLRQTTAASARSKNA